MKEIVINIHIHTIYSDGNKNHIEVIREAAGAGLDGLIFTDHNVYVDGIEGYYKMDGRNILVLMGEEIHDTNANPQKNHLLAIGIDKDLSIFSADRHHLIKKIHSAHGGAFLAHPFDPALPYFNEPDISWEDWDIEGFDGIELWNGFSELKVRAKNRFLPYFFAFFPKYLPMSPALETVNLWNDLHRQGKIISAIAGSDAHAIPFTAGPFKKVIFPYRYHFSTLNNHVLLENDLVGNFEADKKRVISAINKGKNYLANDLIGSATGFNFYLEYSQENRIEMGAVKEFEKDLIAHIHSPKKSEIRIIKDGNVIQQRFNARVLDFPLSTYGVYRVECYRHARGKKRGWIFSNPIYIRQNPTL